MAALTTGCRQPVASTGIDLRCADCSLVLISIDTLRADHLSCYGYARPTSPGIDRFAAGSLLFEAAYSPSYHTADSHMSIFTGTYPSVHRVRNVRSDRASRALPAAIGTLPEALSAAGFVTAGFHGGGNVSAPYGFSRGFSTYEGTLDDLRPAVSWLEQRSRRPAERFFLFAHTYRTHDPYLPDPPYNRLWLPDYQGAVFSEQSQFAEALEGTSFEEKRTLFWSRVDPDRPEDVAKVMALYDGEIRQVDDEVTALLDHIAELPQRTLVVLLSDHGEEFFEHGGNLHDQVYEETLRVPLLIRHPDGHGSGRRIPWRTSLVDLAPTLLHALDIQGLSRSQGRSLLPDLLTPERDPRRPILAEKVVGDDAMASGRDVLNQALLVGNLKVVAHPGSARKLFDLVQDRQELVDRAGELPAELGRLEAALERRNERNLLLWRAVPRTTQPVELDRETVERLRALGYLN